MNAYNRYRIYDQGNAAKKFDTGFDPKKNQITGQPVDNQKLEQVMGASMGGSTSGSQTLQRQNNQAIENMMSGTMTRQPITGNAGNMTASQYSNLSQTAGGPPPPAAPPDSIASSNAAMQAAQGTGAGAGAGAGPMAPNYEQEIMDAIRKSPRGFTGAGIGAFRTADGKSVMDLPPDVQARINSYLGGDEFKNLISTANQNDPAYVAQQQVDAAQAEAERARAEAERLRNSINANPAQSAPVMDTREATLGTSQASSPTTTAVAPLENVVTAGSPQARFAQAVGGSSEDVLRDQQMKMTRDAIAKGEKFGQDAMRGLRDFNITDAGMNFNQPAATSQQIELDRFTPAINASQIGLNQIDPQAQARDASLASFNERINLGDFAPTAGASQFETDFGNSLLARINQANERGASGYDPTTSALLADLDQTAERQRERDIAQLNQLGVLQSGSTADVFQEGNQNLRRDRLAAIAQGYGLGQNDPALSTALELARLSSDRGITGDSQRLTGRSQDLTAGQGNVNAALAARGQDLEATLANQATDLDAQRLNLETALTGRDQDLQAGRFNQQADLEGQLRSMDAGLAARNQDLDAAGRNQLADLDAQRLNMDQQLGIADRQLMDAGRRSGDERFASDLGLRQLGTQQDLADRVTGRQLIMGDPTSRERFEEDVRRSRVGETQFGQSLQQEKEMQTLRDTGAVDKLKQQGLNDEQIQRLVNQGALSAQARSGFDAQELQRIVNEGQLGLQQDQNQLSRDLAIGRIGEEDTLSRRMTEQDLELRRGLDPLAIASQEISNRDQESLIDERNVGQALALAEGLDDEALKSRLGTGLRDQDIRSMFDRIYGNERTPPPPKTGPTPWPDDLPPLPSGGELQPDGRTFVSDDGRQYILSPDGLGWEQI